MYWGKVEISLQGTGGTVGNVIFGTDSLSSIFWSFVMSDSRERVYERKLEEIARNAKFLGFYCPKVIIFVVERISYSVRNLTALGSAYGSVHSRGCHGSLWLASAAVSISWNTVVNWIFLLQKSICTVDPTCIDGTLKSYVHVKVSWVTIKISYIMRCLIIRTGPTLTLWSVYIAWFLDLLSDFLVNK